MITIEQLQQFAGQGYFILPDLFPAAEIDSLREHIDRFAFAHQAELATKQTEGISRANEISFTIRLAEQDPHIWQFVAQDKLVRLSTELVGPDVSLYWNQAVYKKPETHRDFPWHQDNGYVPVEPIEYVTCWLALDDANVENGCVWVLPGSHKQGMVKHETTPIGKQCYFGEETGVPVELKKGSMVVFSSLLFHRSGPNVSQTERKGYIIQFTPDNARHGVTGEPFNRAAIAKGGAAVPPPVTAIA